MQPQQHQQQPPQIKRSPSPTPPLNKKPKSGTTSTRKRKHEEISTVGANNNTKENGNSNDLDLTKNMEAPLAQPHVEEVNIPKSVNIKKETNDYQPYRNGTLIDLDEDNNTNSNEENKVFCNFRLCFYLF
jgi:hypothetical protein